MGATSYTWNTNATTTVVAVSPTTTTVYTVTGVDANGCANMAMVTQSVSSCAGLKTMPEALEGGVLIYPNPNNGLFTIELTSASKVTVTNALGQLVIAEIVEAGNHHIDIINQSNGVYFVKIIENNTCTERSRSKQQIIKVIKQ